MLKFGWDIKIDSRDLLMSEPVALWTGIGNQDCNERLLNFTSKWYQMLVMVALPLLIFKLYAIGGVD